jgi:membrane carboxypeptidase/penicillin-binding protein
MSVRRALAKSKNMVSIRVLQLVGTQSAQQWVGRFGFDIDKHPPYLTMALGAGSVTVMQMATGYSVFANGGYLVRPHLITRITDYKNRVLVDSPAPALTEEMPRAIPERTIATTIVKNVRVLAIDQNFATNAEGETARLGSTATLEVSPQEAELLAMSMRRGEVSLSLRPLDQMASGTDRSPRIELLEGDDGAAGSGITIIRNGQPSPAGVGGN